MRLGIEQVNWNWKELLKGHEKVFHEILEYASA